MEQTFIKPKFLVFPTKEKADKYVSDLVVKQIQSNPSSNLCLPTGSTPLGIYKNLIDAYNASLVSFANVTTFNLDEYIGLQEKDYNKSYHFYMDQNLFNFIDINKENTFFPIDFGFDPNQNPNYDYIEYDRLIESKGWLDLALLGTGENGHIGFNEPNTPYESFTGLVQLSENTISNAVSGFGHRSLVPNYAITMGIQSILYSRKIILIAYGKNKANALYQLFFNNDFLPEWPITSLNYHNDVTIVCDKDAAELIMAKKIN